MFNSPIWRQDFIGASHSNEKGDDIGLAYICCSMNGMWQEGANITPTKKGISYYLGYDLA